VPLSFREALVLHEWRKRHCMQDWLTLVDVGQLSTWDQRLNAVLQASDSVWNAPSEEVLLARGGFPAKSCSHASKGRGRPGA